MSPAGPDGNDSRRRLENDLSEPAKLSPRPRDPLVSRGEPEGCLFVASLEKTKSDTELTISVMRHFQQYGRLIHVKVLKDPQGRPYSFVQFEKVEDAKRARQLAHDAVVDGRRIRVEPARVNRTLYVTTRSNGDLLTEEEIRDIVEATYGFVESMHFPEAGDAQDGELTHSKGAAAYVKFRYRDDAVKAYLGLRQLKRWHVEWSANLEHDGDSGQARPARTGAAAPHSASAAAAAAVTAPGDGDRCAIFVGQLNPQRVNQRVLEDRFRAYGIISNCDFYSRGAGPNRAAFAFIRFSDEAAAQRAIARENGQKWFDRPIRVQQRCGGPTRYPRAARNGFPAAQALDYFVGAAPVPTPGPPPVPPQVAPPGPPPPTHYVAGGFSLLNGSVPHVASALQPAAGVHHHHHQRGWSLPAAAFYAPRNETGVRFAPYYAPAADQGWHYEGQVYYSYPFQTFQQNPYDPAVHFALSPYHGASFPEYATYVSGHAPAAAWAHTEVAVAAPAGASSSCEEMRDGAATAHAPPHSPRGDQPPTEDAAIAAAGSSAGPACAAPAGTHSKPQQRVAPRQAQPPPPPISPPAAAAALAAFRAASCPAPEETPP